MTTGSVWDGSRHALLSVTDKTGIVELAQGLSSLGITLWSTGGTANRLRENGLMVRDVAELTGAPLFGDLVKTLSREVAAGCLCDPFDPEHAQKIVADGIKVFELVCVNFYPLEQAIAAPGATNESVRINTDVGGPTMAHESAKGRKGGYRVVVTDPRDYNRVLDWLRRGKPEAEQFVREFAGKAEIRVASYLLASGRHLGAGDGVVGYPVPDVVGYAENRWQQLAGAGYFATDDVDPLALHRFARIAGSAPGVVGLTDQDSLLRVLTHVAAGFDLNFHQVPLIAVAVKHGNPCGAAVGSNPEFVARDVVLGNPEDIFGGVIATNFTVDGAVANQLLRCATEKKRPIDGVLAPAITSEAVELLSRHKTMRGRLLVNPALASLGVNSLDRTPLLRQVRGGFIRQSNYDLVLALDDPDWDLVGKALDETQQRDLLLAWAVASTSSSNTLTAVRNGRVVANAVGQQGRFACAKLLAARAAAANDSLEGTTVWSDSFFPFEDALCYLADEGVRVIGASRHGVNWQQVRGCAERSGITFLTLPDEKVRGFCKH